MIISEILAEKNITIPNVPVPIGNYTSFAFAGNHLYISGQLPIEDGHILYQGKLGQDCSFDQGVQAARLCGLNILAQLNNALDHKLENVKRCIKLGGYINATADFHDHPKILNGASDLMVDIFGDKGRHARLAIGVASLPLNAAVEIDAIFEVEI